MDQSLSVPWDEINFQSSKLGYTTHTRPINGVSRHVWPRKDIIHRKIDTYCSVRRIIRNIWGIYRSSLAEHYNKTTWSWVNDAERLSHDGYPDAADLVLQQQQQICNFLFGGMSFFFLLSFFPSCFPQGTRCCRRRCVCRFVVVCLFRLRV